jgi:hypothetical protein
VRPCSVVLAYTPVPPPPSTLCDIRTLICRAVDRTFTLTPRVCSGEVCGLAAHPIRDEFVTVGDDATLRVYDLNTHRLLRMTRLAGPSRCVAYSPDGTRLAIGMGAPAPAAGYSHWDAVQSLAGEVTTPLLLSSVACHPVLSCGVPSYCSLRSVLIVLCCDVLLLCPVRWQSLTVAVCCCRVLEATTRSWARALEWRRLPSLVPAARWA